MVLQLNDIALQIEEFPSFSSCADIQHVVEEEEKEEKNTQTFGIRAAVFPFVNSVILCLSNILLAVVILKIHANAYLTM